MGSSFEDLDAKELIQELRGSFKMFNLKLPLMKEINYGIKS